MKKTVLKFIANFQNDGTIETFTRGCCYWFAYILHERFPDSFITYDEIINHFGCYIDGVVYDITGDVSDKYNWVFWDTIESQDPKLHSIIVRDCVLKVD